MKIFTRLLPVLAMMLLAATSYGQITIGTGTTTSQHPLNYYYGHGRHAAIYTAAEMGTTITGGTITTLSWYSNPASGQNTGPTVILLKEVGAQTTIASGAVYATETSGATSVYSGTPTTPGNGWNSIDISDFTLNSGQNLMVIVECDIAADNLNCAGIGLSTTNSWRYTASASGTGATWQYDDTGSGPCTPGTLPTASTLSYRPNIILGGLLPPAPACTTNTTPANNATNVSYAAGVAITWAAANFATSYDVYVATGCGGGVGAYSLVNNFVTTSGTIPGLSASTQYSWYVVPKNANGDASGCVANATCFTTAVAPPANDNCAGALSVTVNPALTCTSVTSGTVLSASASTGPTSSCGTFDDDVWFSFVATSTSHIVTIQNIAGSVTDMSFQVLNACGAGSSLVCSDPNTATASGLTIGNTYFIRVATFTATGGQTTTFDVCVTTPPPPPVNDECASALPFTVSPFAACSFTSVVTTNGTMSTSPTSTCFSSSNNDDIFYTFSTTTAGSYTFSYQNFVQTLGTATQVAFQLYSGASCGALTEVSGTCNLGYGSAGSGSVAYTLLASTNYYLRICAAGSANSASFDFCIKAPAPPPANDDCGGAAALSVSAGTTCTTALTGQTTAGATQSQVSCSGTADDDVWYSFVANGTSNIITLSNVAGSVTMVTQVFSGTCAGLASVVCGTSYTTNATGLTSGNTYYIRVHTSASGTTATFDICVTSPPPPPANDECAGALSVTVNPALTCTAVTSGTVLSSTTSTGPTSSCGTFDDDVWFSFVATSTSHVVTIQNIVGSVTDMSFQVLNACGAGTALVCSDPNTATVSGLTIGNTYFIRVATFSATGGQTTTFDVCVTTPPPPPANDECASALPFTVSPFAACSFTSVVTTNGTLSTAPTSTCFSTSNNDDIFYTFSTTAAGSYTFSYQNFVQTLGTATQVAFQLYSGASCGALTEVSGTCNLGYGTAGSGSVAYTLLASTSYYLRICAAGSANSASFDFCIKAPPPPPANDECAGALSVTVNPALTCTAVTSGTVVSSTASTGPTSSCGTFDDDVWFSFVATSATQIVTIQNIVGSVTDMSFQVSSACGAGTALVCSDPNTATLNGLTIGNTYFIRVATFTATGGQTTTFDVCVTTPPPPPANNDCAGATVFSTSAFGACAYVGVSTSAANQSTPNPSCTTTGTDDDIWYTITPAVSGAYTIRYNTLVAVTGTASTVGYDLYTGACGSLVAVSLACNTGFGTGGSGTVSTPALVAGTTYYLRVWVGSSTNSGTWNMCIEEPAPPPANDDCTGAISLTPAVGATCTSATSGTTVNATQSIAAILCASFTGNADDDVWYSFTATTTSHIVTVVGGATLDAVIDVRSGGCNGTNIACADASASAGGTEVATLTGLTVGATYLIRIYGYGAGSSSQGTFTVCVTTPPSMVYTSSTTTQNSANVAAGTQNAQVIGLQVVVTGSNSPILDVTSIDFNTTGSTNPVTDFVNAKVYYTGTSSTFATTNQFGTTVAAPNGAFTVTGTQALTGGVLATTNYFWLTYDINCGAVNANVVDAQCTSVTVGGTPQTPTITAPALSRAITAIASFNTIADGNWSNPATWACGVPPNGTTSPVNINHNVAMDVTASVQSTVTVAISKTLTIGANAFTIGGAGTGAQNLVINGTVAVSGGTLNVGTASTGTVTSGSITFGSAGILNVSAGTLNVGTGLVANVTAGNITIASGATMTVSGGIVNLGPTGGYLRSLSASGTLTVSGGTLNVNGSITINSSATFNQSAGDIVIDGNGGSSAASLGASTATLLISSGLGSVSGGTITIVDPNFNSGSGKALDYNVTTTSSSWGTGHTLRFGDGISSQSSSNTSGFIVECYTGTGRLFCGNVEIKGGSATNRWTSLGAWSLNVKGTLTVDAGSEIRLNSGSTNPIFAGDIINNGTITSTVTNVFASLSGTSVVPGTIAQTISGGGVFRNLTASPTANFTSLTVNNPFGLTISSATALTGTGTGSVSGTLTLTAGKVNNSSPLTLGTTTGSNGTLTGGSSTSYITGEFRRWNTTGTGTTSRIFPIGSTSSYQPISINFTLTQTAGGVISALFTATDPGTSGLPLLDGGITCDAVSPSGYWTVERLSGGSGGTYTADANATGFLQTNNSAITVFAQIRLLKSPTVGSWTNTDGTPVAPAGLSSVTRTGCTTFSKFAIGGTNNALPIELKSFTGKTLDRTNLLVWETQTEKNVEAHIVERSVDGIHWIETGRKAGQTYSTTLVQYQLEDKQPLAKAYYRLRSVDFDGAESISSVILLTRKGSQFGITTAFPSPTNNQVTVQFASQTEEQVTIRVMDINGRIVLSQTANANNGINETQLQLATLPSGVYTMTVENSTAVTAPVRIVKE